MIVGLSDVSMTPKTNAFDFGKTKIPHRIQEIQNHVRQIFFGNLIILELHYLGNIASDCELALNDLILLCECLSPIGLL